MTEPSKATDAATAAKETAVAAKTKSKAKAEETAEETVTTNDRRLEREPSAMHHRLAAYIEEQTGYEPDIKTVQLVSNMRNEWRKTDDYVEFRAEQEAAKAEENGEAAPKAKAKAAPKKAAPKKKAAAKKTSAKAPAKRTRKTKATASDEDPFDD